MYLCAVAKPVLLAMRTSFENRRVVVTDSLSSERDVELAVNSYVSGCSGGVDASPFAPVTISSAAGFADALPCGMDATAESSTAVWGDDGALPAADGTGARRTASCARVRTSTRTHACVIEYRIE
jgi:hypothetical protein